MPALFPLKFPPYHFRMRRSDGNMQIWDPLRRKWLVLTPEEWVRQHVVRYLAEERGVVKEYIVQEYPVDLFGMSQRADIVVVDKTGAPGLLVECKAPEVTLGESCLSQAMRYNSVLKAPWLAVTNGLQLFCCRYEASEQRYTPAESLPDFSAVFR